MKRLLCIVVVFLMMFTICGCSETNVNRNATVTLTFIYLDKDICVTLEDEDAEKVINILDGKAYDPISEGVPSCGFDKDISLKVGNRVFAIASDTCNIIQDLGNFRYFHIPKEDMAYIHSLFEKHGGYFPCV